jgi:hypothetical protein
MHTSHLLSLLLIPVMESSGQSGASKQAPINKPAHVYKMFRASGDYSAFEAEVIHPNFRSFPRQFLMHHLVALLNPFVVSS